MSLALKRLPSMGLGGLAVLGTLRLIPSFDRRAAEEV